MPLSRVLTAGLLALLIYIAVPVRAAREPVEKRLCGRIYFISEKRIKLEKNERILVCGDKKRNAWKKIPKNQARFHLKNFLQARGYHHPVFAERDGNIYVTVGEITNIRNIKTVGDVDIINIYRRRNVGGRPLTPTALGTLESWTRERLQSRGYPCPEVASRADARTGEVLLQIRAGPERTLEDIRPQPIPGLESGVLRRYDAFRRGRPYNGDFLVVTSKRMEDEGIVQSAHFREECEGTPFYVEQITVPGPPRILTFGIGANTEGLILGKASWKNTRLGRKGSLIDITGIGSFKQQQIDLSVDWYILEPSSRWYLKPLLSFLREDEEQYEFIQGRFRAAGALRWDTHGSGGKLFFGPELSYIRTFRGADTGLSRFLSLTFDGEWMSHYFEFYRTSPRRGYRFNLRTAFNSRNLLSDFTAQKLELTGEHLWNFRSYDPPLIVFGLRGGIMTTIVSQDAGTLARLPPAYRYFLGGSRDLRGFGRGELPGHSEGGLSAVWGGIEVRFGILPYNLQPFLFADVGTIAGNRYLIEPPLYWNPGIGLRWEMPFGSIRATGAYGFVVGGDPAVRDELSHPQFYVSFGEEF